MADGAIELSKELPELSGDEVELPDWVVDTVAGDVDIDAAPLVNSHTVEIPPERVRFAVPVELKPEGTELLAEGAVLNLSLTGVACQADVILEPGHRVWASFALRLGSRPMTLLCEVVWRRRPRQGDEIAYGLRFLSMTRTEVEEVREVVRERAEGRAGEWPMPLLPLAEVAPERRGPSPMLTALAGMAAGIALSLAMSVIPNTGVGSSPRAEANTPATAVTPAVVNVVRTEPDLPELEPGVEPEDEPDAEPGLAPPPVFQAPAPDPQPDLEFESEAEEPMAEMETAPDSELAPEDLEPEAAVESAPKVLRPFGTPDEVTLSLLADGPVDQHVAFWLTEPRRLVIDVPGRNSGFDRHTYEVDHPLVGRLRVGDHPGKVRYVIETSQDVSTDVDTRRDDGALVVTLRRSY